MNKINSRLAFTKLILYLLIVGFMASSLYLIVSFSLKNCNLLGLPKAVALFIHPEKSALDNTQNRVNFLLLGAGGADHNAPDLTDTMIFASLDLKTADLVMLAIPRDIWLEDLGTKINAVYHFGQEKGQGLVLAKESAEKITGQMIHYAMLVDFEGFKEAIDLLGGLKILVDRSFVDHKYPIPGKEEAECQEEVGYRCRYQAVSFQSGWQIMDGEQALQFVRSRNAEGEEGTDFARSKRQQKILLAFKNKLLSPKMLLKPNQLLKLKEIFMRHVETDLPLNSDSMAALSGALLKFSINKKPIRTLTLETGDEENPQFLINPPAWQYGQWVLLPRTGNWQEIHQYLQDKIEGEY